MHDGVVACAAEDGVEHLPVADVAHDQFAAEHGLAPAGGEVVEDGDCVPGRAELLDDVAADVAGAAGDEDAGGGAGSAFFHRRIIASGVCEACTWADREMGCHSEAAGRGICFSSEK